MVFTVFRPQLAIVFLLLLYPMEQVLQANIPQLASALWLTNVIVGLLVLFASVRAFLGRPSPMVGYMNMVSISALFLYAWTYFGVLFAPSPEESIAKLRASAPYFTLLLIFPTLLVTRLEDWRRIIVPTLIGGSLVLVLMLLSPRTSFAGSRLVIDLTDVTGAAGNPLATAQLGGLMAVFGVLYRPSRGGGLLLLIRLTAVGLGLGVAALSGSRGQLLAAIATSVICFPIARQIRNPVQFFGAVVTGIVFLGLGYAILRRVLSGEAGARWDADELQGGVESRLGYAQQAISEWASDPGTWFVGNGTFSSGTLIAELEGTYVHNAVVQALTENGLLGFSLFALTTVLTIVAGARLTRMFRDDPMMRAAAACAIGMALYQFILALKQGDYAASGAPFWAMLIVGKLAAAERQLSDRENPSEYDYDEDEYEEDWYEEDGNRYDEDDGYAEPDPDTRPGVTPPASG